MSIILFILDTQPPSLLQGYNDFQKEIAGYLGYGVDPNEWTTAEQAELDRDVNEAYNYVLYPTTMPGGNVAHVWSWLRRWTTIATTASTQTQDLPADFGSMHSRDLYYDPSTGWVPVQRTTINDIVYRNQWESYEEHPWLYATRWKAQTSGLNQRQEIMWYPTPDSAYTIHYEYAVLTNKLGKRNPYPLGGPRISQLMIEACKAIGEAKKNGRRGDQWTIFERMLSDAIKMDSATLTDRTAGRMRGQYDTYDRHKVFYGVRSLSGSTYNGVV